MFTSNYASLKKITAAGLEPVSISAGKPRWYRGRHEPRLAPEFAWLKMSKADYDERFFALLNGLDMKQLAADLGPSAVLLCWEAANTAACHRRAVAERFEEVLGIVVPELGYERHETPAYHDMAWGGKPKAKAAKPAKPEFFGIE